MLCVRKEMQIGRNQDLDVYVHVSISASHGLLVLLPNVPQSRCCIQSKRAQWRPIDLAVDLAMATLILASRDLARRYIRGRLWQPGRSCLSFKPDTLGNPFRAILPPVTVAGLIPYQRRSSMSSGPVVALIGVFLQRSIVRSSPFLTSQVSRIFYSTRSLDWSLACAGSSEWLARKCSSSLVR